MKPAPPVIRMCLDIEWITSRAPAAAKPDGPAGSRAARFYRAKEMPRGLAVYCGKQGNRIPRRGVSKGSK
jgi:hypothetical protein